MNAVSKHNQTNHVSVFLDCGESDRVRGGV